MSQTADHATADAEPANELLEPRWAVVSFERCEAIDLAYAEAVKKMTELESQSVAGLCIVTNETAERM